MYSSPVFQSIADDIDNYGTTTTTTELTTYSSSMNTAPCYNNWLLIQLKGLSLAEVSFTGIESLT